MFDWHDKKIKKKVEKICDDDNMIKLKHFPNKTTPDHNTSTLGMINNSQSSFMLCHTFKHITGNVCVGVCTLY